MFLTAVEEATVGSATREWLEQVKKGYEDDGGWDL
jgi:hypothetical protein